MTFPPVLVSSIAGEAVAVFPQAWLGAASPGAARPGKIARRRSA